MDQLCVERPRGVVNPDPLVAFAGVADLPERLPEPRGLAKDVAALGHRLLDLRAHGGAGLAVVFEQRGDACPLVVDCALDNGRRCRGRAAAVGYDRLRLSDSPERDRWLNVAGPSPRCLPGRNRRGA